MNIGYNTQYSNIYSYEDLRVKCETYVYIFNNTMRKYIGNKFNQIF